MDVTCRLSEEGSHETNEQEYEKVKCFLMKIDLQSQNVGIGW